MAVLSDVTIPHLDLPFRFVGSSAAVVEQDTVEEIVDCVKAIVRYSVGFRIELPTFGTPDLTFSVGGADPAVIASAVQQWEPRAGALAEADNESLDEFVSNIVLSVNGGA